MLNTSPAPALSSSPPIAPIIPKVFDRHGEKVVDNYNWLREKGSPEVKNYLEAENSFFQSHFAKVKPLSETLYKEYISRIKQSDSSAPYRFNDFYYYFRTVEGLQYPIYCRKPSLTGPEEILLDQNELAKNQKFSSLGVMAISPNAQLLAYAQDSTGFREYQLYILDLKYRKLLAHPIGKIASFAWAPDNDTFYFTTEDSAKRPDRLFSYTLSKPSQAPLLLLKEKDALYRLGLSKSTDRKLLLVTSASSNSTEYRWSDFSAPFKLKLIEARQVKHEYYVDHHEGTLFIRTNSGAPEFKLVKTSLETPGKAHWKAVLAEDAQTPLRDFACFKNHITLERQRKGVPLLSLLDLQTNKTIDLPMPEPVYEAHFQDNAEYERTSYRFGYTSMVQPKSVFDYDPKSMKSELIKVQEIPGGYDPSNYVSDRVWATAQDGKTKIPVSLVYNKSKIKKGEAAPLLLYGYGSYGYELPVNFSLVRLSLLDRGVIFAQAHIRGGADLGEKWYLDGKLENKQNTFNDFIAAADFLVDQKYTRHELMAIQGGSAGGLLIGAVINKRPDIARIAHLAVPFVDVMNTMLDATLPLTVGEYLEWGNPNIKKDYDYMKAYCPYTNLGKQKYPQVLVTTSLNDSQVMYWEPAKYVAKMRALNPDSSQIHLRTNMDAGHGGNSGRYDSLKEDSEEFALILDSINHGHN